ncbi:MAG TPA: hypothetical protein VF145_00925, partial [Chitinophagaceae bacterium]
MTPLRSIFFCCLLLLASGVEAQHRSTLRSKKIAASGSVQLDSLSTVPQSLSIPGFDSSYFDFDPVRSALTWKKSTGTDSVTVRYRVFPFRFDAAAYRFDYDSIRRQTVFTPYVIEKDTRRKPATALFEPGNLDYSGSFGRSLSFGNNQDAVFNSQLNLQMSGFIGDSVEIVAAVTDNNLPVQPDGTTQQLNEFDRILLQFRKKGWELSLGDIDIRQSQSYFLNFYKRLQGVSYKQTTAMGKNGSNNLLAGGAIAKGRFARNIIRAEEGNQGPYRLQGVNNEFFFIVLAGTERVYIDGELVQRGEDQDYVINYNTAEVTFTPRRMITRDSRIQVEFEYADRNFLNSMLYASDEITFHPRLSAFVSIYSNTDAKNSPINQSLDPQQKQFLAGIGDSIQSAFYPVFSIDSFSASRILYKKTDTSYAGVTVSIYVYSTNPDSAKYSLNFIEVGFGRGNYIPLFNAANGKVYQWVEPVNGVPQGNFEPAVFLVTPKKHQVIAGGVSWQPAVSTRVTVETAVSDYNANTFSSKDQSDNKGFAGKITIQRQDGFKGRTGTATLTSTVGYEYVQQQFRPVERLRTVEFGRDWGLGYVYAAADEHLPSLAFKLTGSNNNYLEYAFNSYLRSDRFRAFRHSFRQLYRLQGWQFNSSVQLTSHQSPLQKGTFFRPTAELSRRFPNAGNILSGVSYSLEQNLERERISDTVTAASFAFEVISAFIKSDPQKLNRWSLSYFTRADKLPGSGKLVQSDRSHNYSLSLDLLQNRDHQLRTVVSYRQLQPRNKQATGTNRDNSLLGRVEYMVNEWDGLVAGSVLYEMGAGQEQRRDFSYIEVPAGRGEYAWNDYNNDGIPQLNEFETALFQDQAKYIRIFTPTNEFIKANYTQLNYTLTIDPRAVAGKIQDRRLKNILTRFSLQSSMQTAKKVLSQGRPEFNPFSGNVSDESLVTLNHVFSNTLSFNRFSTSWGMDLTNISSYNKSLLTYGFEDRELNDWLVKGRVHFGKQYLLELIYRNGLNQLLTPKFANRNYSVSSTSYEPRFIITGQTSYWVQLSYQYLKKLNAAAYGGEKSVSNVLSLDGRYNAAQRTSLTGKFSYHNISFNGTPGNTTGYIMLDGLLPGKN